MILKDKIENIICNIDECGETLYGRHTTQHPAEVMTSNDKSLDPLRTKQEVEPYRGFGYLSLISDPFGKRSQRKNLYFAHRKLLFRTTPII